MKCVDLRWGTVVVAGLLVAVLAGCSGSGGQIVYQYVSERVSYNPDGTRLAFAALGGNGLQYTYTIYNNGGALTLLTPSDNDTDLTDEGGKHPAWSPDGQDICFASRRGGSQALFLMDGCACPSLPMTAAPAPTTSPVGHPTASGSSS